jgi:RNA polymerase sigma-70 factor (ECF subfamily)
LFKVNERRVSIRFGFFVTIPALARYGVDVDAFSQFYRDNKDRLYGYLLRMTAEPQLALDLVQESFTRYLKRYGNREFSKPLLYTIARHAALDSLGRPRATGIDADRCEASDHNPEQQMIHRQAFDRMLAAVAHLAPTERELIFLVATSELTYRELGQVLNISEANVKVRIHRARTNLRRMLACNGE